MNEKQPHLVVCNYSEGPIGGPGCICIIVNRNEIDLLRRVVKQLLEAPTDYNGEWNDDSFDPDVLDFIKIQKEMNQWEAASAHDFQKFEEENEMAKGQSFSLVEYGVFSYPEGLEGWRAFRMEYGGANEDCIWEGTIWLPPWVDRNKWEDEMDQLLSGEEIGT